MLLRMIVLLKDKKLEGYLKKYFDQPSLSLTSLNITKKNFQDALQQNGDIFIIDSSFLPDPKESSIASINMLPETPLVILTDDSQSPERHADLVASGADVVLYSRLSHKTLAEAIDASVDSRLQMAQQTWNLRGAESKTRLSSFLTKSPKMKYFFEMVQKVINYDAPVLLLGETGTGKELLARIIHYEGPRSSGPFIPVNCAALPETLLESELFGHEKGAFTGAIRARRGAFELAHGGTIFLDEIGELQPHMQVKLLRALQEGEIRPLGSEKSMWVDTRVIAATNIDMESAIKNGNFRQDLYYRLSVFSLTIPPLRDRKSDIPVIAQKYLVDFGKKNNKNVNRITDEAIKYLTEYDWPGNVRELINVVERAAILCTGPVVTPDDLPDEINKGINRSGGNIFSPWDTSSWQDRTLPQIKADLIEELEKFYIEYVLTETRGKVGLAAKKAGIHPRGFYDKMKKYGVNKKEFKIKNADRA